MATFNPFNPAQIKKISEKIERNIKQAKSTQVIRLGVSLLLISLAIYLASASRAEQDTVSGFDLIFRFNLRTSQVFCLFHILSIAVLLIPNFTDKFRFATLFTLTNIFLFFLQYVWEAPRKIAGYPETLNVSIICFIILLVCWILFGLESYKTESKLILFKWYANLDKKIQYFCDEYGGLSLKEAFKKYKKRRS